MTAPISDEMVEALATAHSDEFFRLWISVEDAVPRRSKKWPDDYTDEDQRLLRAAARAALAAVYPMIVEKVALYCEANNMGMSIRRDGPFNGWHANPADPMGTHPGKGYAAALRKLKGE